jgi:hypothetical protein
MSRARLPLAAGLCLACAILYGCGQSSESARQIAALTNQVAVLKLQAQATRDWTSIANLQASYGFYLDTKRWDDAADLFAKHATLEIVGPGLLEGQDSIRSYLRGLGEAGVGTRAHPIHAPAIHVGPEGFTAKARWPGFECEYVKEDDVWKISKLQAAALAGPGPAQRNVSSAAGH